ncbi:hypothetical protein WR25_15528 [Diploscapter pachys]|uniref:Uncharacterized protein n=1 Tax=Diploscapter pachys TaxID=2018661 RepID=A0A2A2KKF7_9BILA|nr:hypothetical protein WR25_15528 [Diploscapter pachys]
MRAGRHQQHVIFLAQHGIHRAAQAQADLCTPADHREHFIAVMHMFITQVGLAQVGAIAADHANYHAAVLGHQLVERPTARRDHFILAAARAQARAGLPAAEAHALLGQGPDWTGRIR